MPLRREQSQETPFRASTVRQKATSERLVPVTSTQEPAVLRLGLKVATSDPTLLALVRDLFANAPVRATHCAPEELDPLLDDCDVVILDDVTGTDIGRSLRLLRRGSTTRCVICVNVTSHSRVQSLLDLGADDAIAAGSTELRSRLNAAVRRVTAAVASRRHGIGTVALESRYHLLRAAGATQALSPRESALLECLVSHAGEVVSVATLHRHVWGGALTGAGQARVRVYVGYLRRKLLVTGTIRIDTIRGTGYQLCVHDRDA